MPAISTPLKIGTAGWNLPGKVAERFPGSGQHLERYARVLNAVEINSSFYRPHRAQTYARWSAMTPLGFRFAVKMPREITHRRRLGDAEPLLLQFLGEAAGLGDHLGPLLVQLPPSLAFDIDVAGRFFDLLRRRHGGGPVACEPRHASWFEPQAEALMKEHCVARVAADPEPCPGASQPGGWPGLVYLRLHGSPRMYWSAYAPAQLAAWAQLLAAYPNAERWCIFDNTAEGAAIEDAMAFQGLDATAA